MCCLLCQFWFPTARAVLYRRVHFSTVDPKDYSLELALRSSKSARSLIRHLVISHPDSSHDHRLEWIALLPERTLLSVVFERMPLSTGPLLLQYPAIRSAPQVTISRSEFLQTEPSNLATILSYPHLESLSVLLKNVPLRFNGTLRLKRLSLGVVAEARPQLLATILQAIEPHYLQKLDLLMSFLTADDVAWLANLLRPHFPTLKHLAIRTLDHTRTEPIVEDLTESIPRLETLACGRNTYTPKLFPLLPPQLRSLTLDSGDNEPFPREELEQAVTRLCKGKQTLANLTIGRHPSYPNTLYFNRISLLCQSYGVSFTINRGRIGEYLTLGAWSC